jgi:alpha-methylacyl-CoA racemase
MGPLNGIRIVEFGGIGAVPFCAQMFADMGAGVIRIERKDGPKARLGAAECNVWFRGRDAVFLDFKKPETRSLVFKLIDKADATIEGFRPGVMERLGLGPEACLARNPRLIYGRLTGYGRQGPLAHAAGHDINYLALSGALHAIGPRQGRPVPPLNIVADLAGGGLMLAFGMVCALLERRTSGRGQVVDAAMVDGCAALMGAFYGWWAGGVWRETRGSNLLDGGAPFYGTYETADGKYVALGAIEPEFYRTLLRCIGADDLDAGDQMDEGRWKTLKDRLIEVFKSKTRDEWCALMAGHEACFAPVLSFEEALHHPHNQARKTFTRIRGIPQPAPTPRFSRSRPNQPSPPGAPHPRVRDALLAWGLAPEDLSGVDE